MKKSGKRYTESTGFSIKKKIIAILIIVVLIIMLILEASLSFFSDIVQTVANAIAGTVNISISDVLIEEEDVIGRPDEEAVFAEEVPVWTVGDVNNFKWTVTNTGRSEISLTNTIRIAWDTSDDLSVEDVIYVYPANMSDDDIRDDITQNYGLSAIISHNNRCDRF